MYSNHNPNPLSDPNYSSHFTYYSQNPQLSFPFPNAYANPPASSGLKPPGVDSFSAAPQLTQPPALSYAQADASSSAYYFDPNLQNWVAKSVSNSVAQEGLQQLAAAQQATALWAANYVYQPKANKNKKSNKRQKKTKVVQSAYCEVCKIDCTSKDVLDTHKLGKKHKKNLEKLQAAAPAPSGIGPQLDPTRPEKQKASKPVEDLETKRRKILEGGAALEAVRVCAICNVMCNSEGVYNFHLAGKKHATMLKRHMAGVSSVAAS